jgi:hypothetical protein
LLAKELCIGHRERFRTDMQMAMADGARSILPRDRVEAGPFHEELSDFERHISEAGRTTWTALVGKHGGFVLAVSLATWCAVHTGRRAESSMPLSDAFASGILKWVAWELIVPAPSDADFIINLAKLWWGESSGGARDSQGTISLALAGRGVGDQTPRSA